MPVSINNFERQHKFQKMCKINQRSAKVNKNMQESTKI